MWNRRNGTILILHQLIHDNKKYMDINNMCVYVCMADLC